VLLTIITTETVILKGSLIMIKPRVGIIGGGVFGTQMLRAFSYAHKRSVIDLVALADINESVLDTHCETYGIKGYTDYLEMFRDENLDAVSVVTPDYLHKQVVLDSAAHGLHILCQKPFDTSVDGCKEMIKVTQENDVLLCVDYHKRFDPGHRLLKQEVKDGNLGKILYGYACMEDIIEVPSVWFKNWVHNSSPVWFLGVHFYDLIYWIIDSKPVSCFASGTKSKLLSLGLDTYDFITAQFKFENGAIFSVDVSWILPNNFTSSVNQYLKVVGTEGIYEVDSESRGILNALTSNTGAATKNPFAFLLTDDRRYGVRPSGYAYESMLHFTDLVSMLKNGSSVRELDGLYCNGEDAMVSVQMGQMVHRSLESGAPEFL